MFHKLALTILGATVLTAASGCYLGGSRIIPVSESGGGEATSVATPLGIDGPQVTGSPMIAYLVVAG